MVAVATLVGITLSLVSLTGGYMVVKQRVGRHSEERLGEGDMSAYRSGEGNSGGERAEGKAKKDGR